MKLALPHLRPQLRLRTLGLAAWVLALCMNDPLQADAPLAKFVAEHCSACHSESAPEAGLNLVNLANGSVTEEHVAWEKVIRRLKAGQMPPEGEPQPERAKVESVVATLGGELDEHYFRAPRIAKTETLRRLNRTEYQNAIRDLLGLEIDAAALLPPDESSHGFDNITVTDLSPTLLSRAITAAQKISHLAIGAQKRAPSGETYRVRPDITQEEHVPGLPIGTRGGTLIRTHLPRSGTYEITVRLARDRNEEVEGLYEAHEMEILVDRQRAELFTIEPPPGRKDFTGVDAHLKVRVPVSSGAHAIGVTFIKKPSSVLETKRQPYNAHYNMHRHPRLSPAVYEVSITGPLDAEHAESDAIADAIVSAERTTGVISRPASPADEQKCAEENLRRIMRQAYRRPIVPEDLREPMEFFASGRDAGGFELGMEQALTSVLVNPYFLFRLERTPSDVASGETYRISDTELASRLSFFLWSSLPDETLLELAEAGTLHEPAVLAAQVERMLHDERSRNLVDNFAEQWLYLRNLESITPDLRLYPDFDDNLRQAFRQETKLLFESVMREDRSVLDLLQCDYTFLNERLAKHYGIPSIYGSRFRRVELPPESHRGGLLRHGSILTVTSYATRTSPVIRGHWVLKNIVGSPPPPPPPDVPALKDNTVSVGLSMRARLAEHRAQAACAVCHNIMDPVGFALENYDAVGRWRESEDGQPIDARGGLSGSHEFAGVDGLEKALLERPELFASTMTEKLLTFALGRGIDDQDAPAVRRIVSQAEAQGYRFSAMIQSIVSSPPFQMRTAP